MTYISSGEGEVSGKKMTPKNTDMKEKHLAHGAEGWCRPGAVPLCAYHSPHHVRVAFCISSKDKPKPGVDRGTSLFPPRLSKCARQCDSTICRSQGCPPRHPSPPGRPPELRAHALLSVLVSRAGRGAGAGRLSEEPEHVRRSWQGCQTP